MIGNYKTDAATNKVLVNSTNLPANAADYLIDDVSCIDVDLPAYAGPDLSVAPGYTVFIGRQPDVGIDEACQWFQWPNMSTPIDTVAGLWVSPVVTTTYVVRQEICGNVKWDTVVVYENPVGIQDLKFKIQSLKLFPVPAADELSLEWNDERLEREFDKGEVRNSLGQMVAKFDLVYQDRKAVIDIKELPDGVYVLNLKGTASGTISRRFVIRR